MKPRKDRTLQDIRVVGLRALRHELGTVGMVRFLQQFETGAGDYTSERREWLGEPSVESVANEVEQRKTEA